LGAEVRDDALPEVTEVLGDEIVIRVSGEERNRLRARAEAEGRPITIMVHAAAMRYLESVEGRGNEPDGDFEGYVTPVELAEMGITQEQLDQWVEEAERD
jgi:hypothetical protein